jgi:hypothetical protein
MHKEQYKAVDSFVTDEINVTTREIKHPALHVARRPDNPDIYPVLHYIVRIAGTFCSNVVCYGDLVQYILVRCHEEMRLCDNGSELSSAAAGTSHPRVSPS